MAEGRRLKRQVATTRNQEHPAVDPVSLPSFSTSPPPSERPVRLRKKQKTFGRNRGSNPPPAANSRRATSTDMDDASPVDPHLQRLCNEGVDLNTPLVNQTRFAHAPDPTKDLPAAKAFGPVVGDRMPQPSCRPLACIDTSEVKAGVLCAVDEWIYQGKKQHQCIKGYIKYGGQPGTGTNQAVLKANQTVRLEMVQGTKRCSAVGDTQQRGSRYSHIVRPLQKQLSANSVHSC